MLNNRTIQRLIFAPEGYLDLDGASIFTSIPKGTLRKYLREQPERFLIHGKMNRTRPALCRVGKTILISVDALHSFLKTKEMVPAAVYHFAARHEAA